jgi:hypothetical protein
MKFKGESKFYGLIKDKYFVVFWQIYQKRTAPPILDAVLFFNLGILYRSFIMAISRISFWTRLLSLILNSNIIYYSVVWQ